MLEQTKRQSYKAHRGASQGAGVTLVSGCGEFVATFECATRIAALLGTRNLRDVGDGIYESIPVLRIPTEEMLSACTKISETYSIALVDLVCDKHATRFCLIVSIPCKRATPPPVTTPKPICNLDEF